VQKEHEHRSLKCQSSGSNLGFMHLRI